LSLLLLPPRFSARKPRCRAQSLPAQSLLASSAPVAIDLSAYFALTGVTGQVVQFDTSLGKFNVELLAGDAPLSVQNFLSYVSSSDLCEHLHPSHRRAGWREGQPDRPGRRLCRTRRDLARPEIPRGARVASCNTPGHPRVCPDLPSLNSATSEWFFNVDDNTSVLGPRRRRGLRGLRPRAGHRHDRGRCGDPSCRSTTPAARSPRCRLRDMTAAQVAGTSPLQLSNFILMNSVEALATYPTTANPVGVIQYSISNSAPSGATATPAPVPALTLTSTRPESAPRRFPFGLET
jgi:hypothetical protein